MRDLKIELNKLISFAKSSDNIRALVLQGSYVNENAPIDDFSDLDPLFFVKDLSEFLNNNDWKKHFGNPISFFHDQGDLETDNAWYTRLTIYDDGFKLDFGFQSVESAKFANEMSLYKVYVDKDNIIPTPDVTDERKFYSKKPTEKEFLDRMNAFFFDTSYIVKSIIREELVFTKYMESTIQENQILPLFEWYIGVKNNFQVNTGVKGRYMKRYLTKVEWEMLEKVYPNSTRKEEIEALFASYELVSYLGRFISTKLGFSYPDKHEKDMLNYCKKYLLE